LLQYNAADLLDKDYRPTVSNQDHRLKFWTTKQR
jgi:hypothetical protein